MKKLVFVFAALFVMGLTSCFDQKPATDLGDKPDTVQVAPQDGDTNQVETTEADPQVQEVAPKENPEAANQENTEAKDNATTEEPK